MIDQGPAHGTLGEVTAGKVTYYPTANFAGVDTFTYRTFDGVRASNPATVTVTVNNVTDGAGVTISQSGGATAVQEPNLGWTSEDDGGDDYAVVLNTAPSANVTVSISPGNQLSVTPSSLVFTPANWSTPQTVRATAVADNTVEASSHAGTITHTTTSADTSYNGLSVSPVSATVADGDFAYVVMDFSNTAADLVENGAGIGFGVRLTSAPTANVTVSLTGDSQLTLSAKSFTFTSGNWDTPQPVTLTAVNDAVVQGYRPATVTVAATSSDTNYQGYSTGFNPMIRDDDGPSAYGDEAVTKRNTAKSISVMANDLDPGGKSLSISSYTQPSHGTVTTGSGGTLTYTPTTGWSGEDSFKYRVTNGTAVSNEATVRVQVTPTNYVPVVTNPGSQTKAEDAAVSLQITATDQNDTDLIYTATGLPPGLTIDPITGRIWGWVGPQAAGSYSTTVSATDLRGGVGTANFSWTITNTNHRPTIYRFDTQTSTAGQGAGQIGPSGSDIDDEDLTYNVTGLPPGMTFFPGTPGYPSTPGFISGFIPSGSEGVYEVTMTATDYAGGGGHDDLRLGRPRARNADPDRDRQPERWRPEYPGDTGRHPRSPRDHT